MTTRGRFSTFTAMNNLSLTDIQQLFKPRESTSHKGNHGHALLIAGSIGKMGAAVIAAKACLRSGCGLLTVGVPNKERSIVQTSVPEAMIIPWEDDMEASDLYSAIGIGSGIGIRDYSGEGAFPAYLNQTKTPMLLDADALNGIATNTKLLRKIPKNTIITPHPKEFDRLFGLHHSTDERTETAIKKAKAYNLVIVLKGHQTLITHNGDAFLNTNGNAGLAKGGSGDALTGIITSFLAQGYEPFDAAKLGVFLHGSAADLALATQSVESMLITDVIDCLGDAFKKINAVQKSV